MSDDQTKKMSDITKGFGELLIHDIFSRHGIRPEQLKPLDEEQKEKIKALVNDLQEQVNQFLNLQQSNQQQSTAVSNPQPSNLNHSNPSKSTRPRKKIGLSKLSEEEIKQIFKKP